MARGTGATQTADILYGNSTRTSIDSATKRLDDIEYDIIAALEGDDWPEALESIQLIRQELLEDPSLAERMLTPVVERFPLVIKDDNYHSLYDQTEQINDQHQARQELLAHLHGRADLEPTCLGYPLAALGGQDIGPISEALSDRLITLPARVNSEQMRSMMDRDLAIQALADAPERGAGWDHALGKTVENIFEEETNSRYSIEPHLRSALNGSDLRCRYFKSTKMLHIVTEADNSKTLCGKTIKSDAYTQADWKFARRGDWDKVLEGQSDGDRLTNFKTCAKCSQANVELPKADLPLYGNDTKAELIEQSKEKAISLINDTDEPTYDLLEEEIKDLVSQRVQELATERLLDGMKADKQQTWQRLLGRRFFDLENQERLPDLDEDTARKLVDDLSIYTASTTKEGSCQQAAFELCEELQEQEGTVEVKPVEEPRVNDWARWSRAYTLEDKPTKEAHYFLPNLPEDSTAAVFTASPACGAKLMMPDYHWRLRKRATERCSECQRRADAGQTRSKH